VWRTKSATAKTAAIGRGVRNHMDAYTHVDLCQHRKKYDRTSKNFYRTSKIDVYVLTLPLPIQSGRIDMGLSEARSGIEKNHTFKLIGVEKLAN
jgi:hypothetical protein